MRGSEPVPTGSAAVATAAHSGAGASAAPPRRLSLEGDLEIEGPGGRLSVAGAGPYLFIELDELSALPSVFRLLGGISPDRETRERRLELADAALRHADVTVEVRHRGKMVARLGSAAKPSGWARRLGLGPAELGPGAAVRWLVTS